MGAREAADRTGKIVTVVFVSAVWPGAEVSARACECFAVNNLTLELQQFIRLLLSSRSGTMAAVGVSSWVKQSWVFLE